MTTHSGKHDSFQIPAGIGLCLLLLGGAVFTLLKHALRLASIPLVLVHALRRRCTEKLSDYMAFPVF